MRKRHFLIVVAAVAVTGCAGADPEPTAARPEGSATTATSRAGPADPATTSTVPSQPETTWPADPPARYAVFDSGHLAVIEDDERNETANLADLPTAGGFVDDALVFSLGCCDGIMRWDYTSSDEADLVVGGQNDEQTTLHGIAPAWERPGFFYTTGDDQPDPNPHLMFHDLSTGEAEPFFEQPNRRPGLTEEEQTASIGRIVATEDLVGMLFAFGDSTWIEWYTDTGEQAESPFDVIGETGTVLDMALAPNGNLLAVGREEQLHQGIRTVDVVATDGSTRSYSVPEGQSLRDLQFEGRYVTASVHNTEREAPPDTPPVGNLILDIEQNHFSYLDRPHILALGE